MKPNITALVRKALENNGQITINELRALLYQAKTDAQILRAGRSASTSAAKMYRESKPLGENDISSLRRTGINNLLCQFIYEKTKRVKNPWLEINGNVVRLKANTAAERNLGP
jgi:hypothetical protein